MIINKIKKYSIGLALIIALIVLLISRSFSNALMVIMGMVFSNINFVINDHFLVLNNPKKAISKSMFSFMLRMLVYVIALTLSFKLFNISGMICCFIGCMSIRIAILCSEIIKKEVK
ncbi:MAG: hypothetical protein LBT75_05295 [Bacilli bacterium]|nr:hypothetical protein [Bacilli bacterium]